MMFCLLLFCLIFSTALGQQDGLTELKENTTTVILTPDNTTLIKLEPDSYVFVDFLVKTEKIHFNIDPKECIGRTVSTRFNIGGGNWIALNFNLTNESFNSGLINVEVTNMENHDIKLNLEEQKIKMEVSLAHKDFHFRDDAQQTDKPHFGSMHYLGKIVTYPFHGEGSSHESRVTFFAFNTGECNISYEMYDMVPLTADNSDHDDATTTQSPPLCIETTVTAMPDNATETLIKSTRRNKSTKVTANKGPFSDVHPRFFRHSGESTAHSKPGNATTASTPSLLYNATSTTTSSKDESNESWYEGSTFQKIVYAYLWILSCGLFFIIGICAGRVGQRTQSGSTNV